MPLTPWNPATTTSRGNIAIWLIPTITDITKPTVAQVNNGTSISCSITAFSGTSSTDVETIDWLCSMDSEQVPGATTHSIDDLLIKSTGQADTALLSALNVGNIIYVVRRDGLPQATAPAAGQQVWVWQCVVTSIDPSEADNAYLGLTAHLAVMRRSAGTVGIIA